MPRRHEYHLHALLHSADLVEDCLREALTPLGIRPKQARVLYALDRIGSATQIRVAREVNVTAGSMSTMIARLEKLGLLTRQRDPDERRRDVLTLTESGRVCVRQVYGVWRGIDRLIEQRIGAEKARQLAETADDLRMALGGRAPGDSSDE